MKKKKTPSQVPQTQTWYTMSQAAKLIGLMGRNKMYQLLRDEQVLMHHNEPYQAYCDAGYFKLEQVPKFTKSGQLFRYFPVLYVSIQGIEFIKTCIHNHLVGTKSS